MTPFLCNSKHSVLNVIGIACGAVQGVDRDVVPL